MEPIHFNTFEEYEKNLELVKAEFQQDEPSWLHYWFYRYLQISPHYWAMHLNQSKSKEDQSRYKLIKKFNNNWEKCDQLVRDDGINLFSPDYIHPTYLSLGEVWSIDFARWWYTRARYFFKHLSYFLDKQESIPRDYHKTVIKDAWLHFGFDTREKLDRKKLSSYLRYIKKDLEYLHKEGGYPVASMLTINLQKSKKETIRAFSNFLDSFYGVEDENMGSTFFHFDKTKLKESTLRDCYKVYEMSVYQDKLNLFELGIKADVIKGAIAEYKSREALYKKNIRIFRSYNSLKSATSRQLRYAHNFALNAGTASFPRYRYPVSSYIELPIEEKRYIFDLLIKESKLVKNQKDALINFAKKEKLKDTKKEYQKIMGKLD
jgi:hypothetical protein